MNNKFKYLSVFVLAILLSPTLWAQQQKTVFSEGKPSIKIFANFNSNLGGNDQIPAQDAMEIKRAYLGYKVNIHQNYKINIGFDVGNNSGRYDVFLKKAALSYTNGKWSANIGLISVNQFGVQEKFWGYRYLRKSFQDQYRYNSSADLGFSLKYQISDMISLDGIFQNGNGYKNVTPTGTFRGGLGTTLKFKSFMARLYYDFASGPRTERQTFVGFLGYQFRDLFKIGGEYNYQLNTAFVEDQDMYGYSVYSTFFISDRWEAFARYDNSMSTEITAGSISTPWNVNRDEQVGIIGVQYKLIKGVKVSTNYRRVLSAVEGADALNWIYLNLEYKF